MSNPTKERTANPANNTLAHETNAGFDKDRYDLYEKALNLTSTPESKTKRIVSGLSLMRDFAGELFAKYSNHSAYTAYLLYTAGNRDELLKTENLASLRHKMLEDHKKQWEVDAYKKFNQIVSMLQDTSQLSSAWSKFLNTQKMPSKPDTENKESLYTAITKARKLEKSKGRIKPSSAESQYLTDEQKQSQLLETATHDRMQAENLMKELWQQPMNMLNLDDLLDAGESVGLSTIFMEAVNTLNKLNNTRYDTSEAYELAYKSEALLAPLCEIIGFDGLAMALRSKVICLQLRNTGQGHFVDLAERILSEFGVLGTTDTDNPDHVITAEERNQNYCNITEKILARMIGKTDKSGGDSKLVLGQESNHNIVVGNGNCSYEWHTELRAVWRLKSVGSLARKLAEGAKKAEKQKREDYQKIRASISPDILQAYDDKMNSVKAKEKERQGEREFIPYEDLQAYDENTIKILDDLKTQCIDELCEQFDDITPQTLRSLSPPEKDSSLEVPFDIDGITFITEDRDELLDVFLDMINNNGIVTPPQDKATQNNKTSTNEDDDYIITPYAAPGRDKILKVEGDTQFIKDIRAAFEARYPGTRAEEYIDFKEDNKKGFRVAKMTGLYEDQASGILPFEVQILTKEDRKAARHGVAAHILYKLGKQLGYQFQPTEEQLTRMSELNRRKQDFGKTTLHQPSRSRINNTNRKIDAMLAQAQLHS